MRVKKKPHAKPAAVIMLMLDTVHLDAPYSAIPVASLICASWNSHNRAQRTQQFFCTLQPDGKATQFRIHSEVGCPVHSNPICDLHFSSCMAIECSHDSFVIPSISSQEGLRHSLLAVSLEMVVSALRLHKPYT